MRIAIDDLTDRQLNYAVGMAGGIKDLIWCRGHAMTPLPGITFRDAATGAGYHRFNPVGYHTGDDLIDEFKIDTKWDGRIGQWVAVYWQTEGDVCYATTRRRAAMLALVQGLLGAEIDLPEAVCT